MMKRKLILWVSFFVTIFLVIVVISSLMTYKATVTINGRVFYVEVADTTYLLEKGLSGHMELSFNEGMLFVFPTPSKYGIWMKDMLFPLDILWIDENQKIVHIEKDISPETYPKIFYPNSEARYVLEVLAGQSDILKIKIGDTIKITKKWL